MITPEFIVATIGLLLSNGLTLTAFYLYHKKVSEASRQQNTFLINALVVLHARNAREAADAVVYTEQSQAQTEQYREAFTEDLKKKTSEPTAQQTQNVNSGTILKDTESGKEYEILT